MRRPNSSPGSYIIGAVADKICYHFSVVQYFPVREVIKKAGNVNRPGPTDANLLKSTFFNIYIQSILSDNLYLSAVFFISKRKYQLELGQEAVRQDENISILRF